MRIPMMCKQCSQVWLDKVRASDEAARARGDGVDPLGFPPDVVSPDAYLVDIQEDNAYVKTCSRGHEMRMTLQHVRYELLFESGVVAMLVGFQREAVSSIAAAVERFYEFAIEVLTHRVGLAPDMTEVAWKHVKRQTERQFGAFLYLFLIAAKKPFKSGKEIAKYEEQFKFRNEVIHAGYFPSQTEVLAFARWVYDLIVETRATITALDANAVREVELRHYGRGDQAIDAKAGGPTNVADARDMSASSVIPLMLDANVRGFPEDFDLRLARAKKLMWMWGGTESGSPPLASE